MYRAAEDPRAAVRNAERKVADMRKKHFPETVAPIPSSVVYGSGSVKAHRYVRTFERLFSAWVVGVMYDTKIGAPRAPDAVKDFFPQQWIRALTDVDVQDGAVALSMLRGQAKVQSERCRVAEDAEESGRSSEKELEESIVSHLTRVFITTHDAMVEMAAAAAAPSAAAAAVQPSLSFNSSPKSSHKGGGPAERSGGDAAPPAAAADLPSLPLRYDSTPVESPPQHQQQQPCSARGQLSSAHRRLQSAGSSGGSSSPQRFVNLGIAQVVCRPGATNPAQKVSKVSNAVQHVLQTYEDREAASVTQQHINDKRGLDNIFTVEKMLEIREKLRVQKQAEVMVHALRQAQQIELHSSPAVAAVLAAGAEKLSVRPRPPSGKVEPSTGAAVTANLSLAQPPLPSSSVAAAAPPPEQADRGVTGPHPPVQAQRARGHTAGTAAQAQQAGGGPSSEGGAATGSSRPQRISSARTTNPLRSTAGLLSVHSLQSPQAVRPKTAYVGAKTDWLPIDARTIAKAPL
jgi:hypothetical protein